MEASGAGRLLLSSYGALMRYEVQPGEIRVVGELPPHPLPPSSLCDVCMGCSSAANCVEVEHCLILMWLLPVS